MAVVENEYERGRRIYNSYFFFSNWFLLFVEPGIGFCLISAVWIYVSSG